MSSATMYMTDPSRMRAMVQFVAAHSWIYDLQMTHFFREEVWGKIPADWQPALLSLTADELNNLPFGFVKESWPDSLKQFCKLCEKLALRREATRPASKPSGWGRHRLTNGMSAKKQHEVAQMAAVVDELCADRGVDCVVDVGCGLGYLGQILSSCYGYRVIGVESVATLTNGAEKQARKIDLSPSQFETVTFELKDTTECTNAFGRLLEEKLSENIAMETSSWRNCSIDSSRKRNNSENFVHNATATMANRETETCDIVTSTIANANRVCLVGLHCCADLSPISLRLFTLLPCISALVCVGCCYHRMHKTDDGFSNFPISCELGSIIHETKQESPSPQLNTFSMRLAAQETRGRWRTQSLSDHERHANNVAFRAILQLEDGIQLNRLNRKLAKRKDYTSFDTYLDAVFESIEKQDNECELRASLRRHYENHRQYFHYIEPFTALQVMLQPVIESLIILDRLQFLREQNMHANVTPIFDDAISPRNLALIAWKPD